MQTRDFANALNELIETLQLENLVYVLEPVMTAFNPSDPISDGQQGAFGKWVFSVIQNHPEKMLSDNALRLLDAFELRPLLLHDSLDYMQRAFNRASDKNTFRIGKDAASFQGVLTSAKALIASSNAANTELLLPKYETASDPENLIVITLPDPMGQGVSTDTFVTVIKALEELVKSLSYGQDPREPARIAFVDSGSMISVGLTIAGAIIAAKPETIRTIFELVAYKQQNKELKDLEVKTKTLEFRQLELKTKTLIETQLERTGMERAELQARRRKAEHEAATIVFYGGQVANSGFSERIRKLLRPDVPRIAPPDYELIEEEER